MCVHEFNPRIITVTDSDDANKIKMHLPESMQDKVIQRVYKTRRQVTDKMENLSAGFRGCMIGASVAATIAVAIKVAMVVGAIGLAATPAGWAIGAIALALAAVGVGILIHRHFQGQQLGYKPETLKEVGIGSLYAVTAGAVTAGAIAIGALILTAIAACTNKNNHRGGGYHNGGHHRGGHHSSSSNFHLGFLLGYSLNSHPHVYVINKPCYVSSYTDTRRTSEVANDKFVEDDNNLYVYNEDQIHLD